MRLRTALEKSNPCGTPVSGHTRGNFRSPNIPKGKLEEVGSAYVWAQSLAGLNFPQEFSEDGPMPVDEVKPDKAVCQTRVEAVVNAIRQR